MDAAAAADRRDRPSIIIHVNVWRRARPPARPSLPLRVSAQTQKTHKCGTYAVRPIDPPTDGQTEELTMERERQNEVQIIHFHVDYAAQGDAS